MMISTRGRYALRVMIDLAEHGCDGLVAMKDVAARQNISLKYLERILPDLVKGGLIEGVSGKGGGYRLKRLPQECRVSEILRLTEGELAPVACLGDGAELCDRKANCRTLPMWMELNKTLNRFFDRYTIANLMIVPEKIE